MRSNQCIGFGTHKQIAFTAADDKCLCNGRSDENFAHVAPQVGSIYFDYDNSVLGMTRCVIIVYPKKW